MEYQSADYLEDLQGPLDEMDLLAHFANLAEGAQLLHAQAQWAHENIYRMTKDLQRTQHMLHAEARAVMAEAQLRNRTIQGRANQVGRMIAFLQGSMQPPAPQEKKRGRVLSFLPFWRNRKAEAQRKSA